MMRIVSLALAVCLVALSRSPIAAADWSALVRKRGFQGDQVGLVVIDAAGAVQGLIRADRAFRPASNQKVLVAASALDVLGAGFRFETTLWSTAAPANGVLAADLAVTGSGDPNISGRFSGGDPTATFRAWAREFKSKGVRRVDGDLLVDDFAFDDVRFNPTWKTDQASRWYSAQVGALSLNDNCVDVTVMPGSVGKTARYRLSPPSAYVSVVNSCKTVSTGSKSRPHAIGLERVPGTNRITLRGWISRPHATSWTGPVTVHDPGLFFGTVLREVFRKEGVEIRGEVVRDRARLAPASRRMIYHRHTSSLALDVPIILGRSQNLHTELLLKALGSRRGSAGSVAGGAAVIRRHLGVVGVPVKGLEVIDGSGLSADNRVAPMTLARLLHRARSREWFPLFRDSLPIGGTSGTLRRRFRDPALRGRVVAKTGYINGVVTLSGYVFREAREHVESPSTAPSSSASGPFWTFSLLINGFPRGRGAVAAYELQEDVAREILRRLR